MSTAPREVEPRYGLPGLADWRAHGVRTVNWFDCLSPSLTFGGARCDAAG